MRPAFVSWLTLTIVAGLCVPSLSTAGPPTGQSECPECDRAVARVLPLLPKQPERVVVIDLERSSPALRQAHEHAEGFVINGKRTVLKLRAARERIRRRVGRCEGRKPFGARPAEAAALERIRQLRRKPKGQPRLSVAAIAARLNAEGVPTRQGGPWRPSSVYSVLQRQE